MVFLHFRDLSDNELTLIPRNGVSTAVLGTSIGAIMPSGKTLTNIAYIKIEEKERKGVLLFCNHFFFDKRR